ncbi:MAG: hypothetical protein VXZ55_08085, partial [Planctomycetota bacterium]|nr:hypothetical protein [Planctomycetota bacterium]
PGLFGADWQDSQVCYSNTLRWFRLQHQQSEWSSCYPNKFVLTVGDPSSRESTAGGNGLKS